MMVNLDPRVRLLLRRGDYCVVQITEALSVVSPVLKAVTEEWSAGDEETYFDMGGAGWPSDTSDAYHRPLSCVSVAG